MKITAVVATLGRRAELADLLRSFKNADLSGLTLQVIIVDQNPKGYISDALGVANGLDLLHIESTEVGLSRNRNIGLKYASGDVVFFPDDDSLIYSNTLQKAVKALRHSQHDFCIGRIFDREGGRNILKNWPQNGGRIGKANFFKMASSITIFLKAESVITFDEVMGAGAVYGSCEDLDYVYRLLISRRVGYYDPNIEVWHPEANHQETPLRKVEAYASGFGYFCRKHDLTYTSVLLILLVSKKLIECILSPFSRRHRSGYFYAYFKGLISGFFVMR